MNSARFDEWIQVKPFEALMLPEANERKKFHVSKPFFLQKYVTIIIVKKIDHLQQK